jgi:hypothetical protein
MLIGNLGLNPTRRKTIYELRKEKITRGRAMKPFPGLRRRAIMM